MMKEQYRPAGLKFTCSQEWESMLPVGANRFCTACSRPVIDFTEWGPDEIAAWLKEKPGSCGQYRVEQLEPDLIALADIGASVRKGSAAMLLALSLQAVHGQAASDPHEVVEQTSEKPSDVGMEVERINTMIPLPIPVIDHLPTSEPVVKPQRHAWFISKRFPFLHRRAVHIRGRRILMTGF